MKKYSFLWIVLSFFIFNILNTFFLTFTALNKYIVAFNHTFLSEVCSILGNFAILAILFILGVLIFKKEKRISIYLMIVTFLLNVAIIALQYYTKGYRLAFSIFNYTLAKSPTGGFGANVFLDWIYELFIYFRIVSLLPFVILLVLFLVFRKKMTDEKIGISLKKTICSFAILIGLSVSTYQYYQYSLQKNWGYSTDYAQYGCQYTGVYNYYVSEFIFRVDNRNINEDYKTEEVKLELDEYNKNKESYTNIIDKKEYSNKDKQTGILKNKNIFVIQMESTMSFCYNAEYNGIEITPNFNRLFQDPNCFYFNNAYTTVGIGNTSDAEFAFFTGYYPTGDMTIAWEFDEYDFQLPTLGDYLDDYLSYSYNPTNESFYNHNNLHEQLYKMTDFRGLETYETIYPKETNRDKYLNYWISDASILNWASKTAKIAHTNGKSSFSFVETITPHNPFPDFSDDLPNFTKYDYNIKLEYYQLTNYINQVKYNDQILYDFLMDVTNPESPNYLENTVFIIYGDHGNALPKKAYESLFNRELTTLEYRRLLLNIPIIFYDPSGTIYNSMDSSQIDSILSQTKSNTDMYRTILNLLGIETDENYYGVNMFSGEPTFSYDPKNWDIITDDFIYNKKNDVYECFNGGALNDEVIQYVLNYRKKQDNYLNTLIYTSNKKK